MCGPASQICMRRKNLVHGDGDRFINGSILPPPNTGRVEALLPIQHYCGNSYSVFHRFFPLSKTKEKNQEQSTINSQDTDALITELNTGLLLLGRLLYA